MSAEVGKPVTVGAGRDCEVCGKPATHVCHGPDVIAIHFCADHALDHEAMCPCVKGGTAKMVEMGSEP